MLTHTLTALALAAAAAAAGAAAAVSRRGRVGPAAVAGAAGAAALVGALGAAGLLAASVGRPLFALVHLAYLGLTVTVPLTAVALGALAARRTAPVLTWALVAAGLLPAPVGFYATHVEPAALRIDRAVVAVAPERAGDDEVRVAVLADLQTNRVGDHERRAVDEVLAAEPDVVLLPGDLFQGDEEELDRVAPAMQELLGRLEAPGGVFFVNGDVDGPRGRHAARVLEGTGIEVLVDRVVDVRVGDRTLRIGGTELLYASRGAARTRDELQRTRPDGAITILLSHRPDTVLPLPARSRVDLTVAGHTHGGQVVVPFVGPIITLSAVPDDVARGGLHEVDGNPIYVSPGVGLERESAPQVRFLSRPAIGVLTLRDG